MYSTAILVPSVLGFTPCLSNRIVVSPRASYYYQHPFRSLPLLNLFINTEQATAKEFATITVEDWIDRDFQSKSTSDIENWLTADFDEQETPPAWFLGTTEVENQDDNMAFEAKRNNQLDSEMVEAAQQATRNNQDFIQKPKAVMTSSSKALPVDIC